MTTFAHHSATTDSVPGTVAPGRALAARRWFLVAAPVLAGLFGILGAAADPGAGISGEQMYRLYTDHPDDLQWKSLGFHWSYAFWMAPALLAVPWVRARGAWIANGAAVLGFAGMTTLPGLLFIDWYDSAIGQVHGVEGIVAVNERLETMWAVPVFVAPGIAGLLLALPCIAVALWRARVVRWWAVLAVVAGQAAFLLGDIRWWHLVVTTVCFSVFSVALARGTRPAPA